MNTPFDLEKEILERCKQSDVSFNYGQINPQEMKVNIMIREICIIDYRFETKIMSVDFLEQLTEIYHSKRIG